MLGPVPCLSECSAWTCLPKGLPHVPQIRTSKMVVTIITPSCQLNYGCRTCVDGGCWQLDHLLRRTRTINNYFAFAEWRRTGRTLYLRITQGLHSVSWSHSFFFDGCSLFMFTTSDGRYSFPLVPNRCQFKKQ